MERKRIVAVIFFLILSKNSNLELNNEGDLN